MQVLLCDEFSTDAAGVISCEGQSTFISLEDLQSQAANNGLTIEQSNELIVASLAVLTIAFVYALILRQLR